MEEHLKCINSVKAGTFVVTGQPQTTGMTTGNTKRNTTLEYPQEQGPGNRMDKRNTASQKPIYNDIILDYFPYLRRMEKIKLTDRIRKWFSGQEQPKQSDFTVEHYPLTGRFYPKYKNKYLKEEFNTGIMITIDDHMFPYALYGESEVAADLIIQRFKEQQLKENVRVIQK